MYDFIGKYYDIKSDIHSINPIDKIISLFLFFILTLIVNNIMFSIILLLFSLIILMLTKVPFKLFLLRSTLALLISILLLVIGLLFKINTVNLILKIISFSIYYSSYIYTTKMIDTNRGLYDIFKFLDIKNYRVPLIFLVLIHLLSIIYSEYYKTRKIRINREIIYSNSFKTLYYCLFKVIERIKIITNIFKVKSYNFNYLQKNDSFAGISILASHLLLFIVYFLGKV